MSCKSRRITQSVLLDVFRGYFDDITNLTLRPESNNGLKNCALAFYVMKEESRVAGPWYDATFKPPETPVVYDGSDLACMSNPWPWQAQVLEWLETPNDDDRSIDVICNPEGNGGKSKLQKFICWHGKAKRISLGLAHQIKNAFCLQKRFYDTYVMNIPRSTGKEESQRDLLSAIEEIKDGWVTAVMFGEEKEVFFKPPRFIIFCNEFPNVSLVSADRWRFWELQDRTSTLVRC